LKQRPGILIVYDESSLNSLSELVNNIKNEEYLIDILRDSYTIHVSDSSTSEFKEISKNFSIHKYPCIIYINKSQLSTINQENVLYIEENFSIDSFRETIFNQINDPRNTPSSVVPQNENINNNFVPHQNSSDFNFHDVPETDSDLIHYQNQELRLLEKEAENRKIKEQKEKNRKGTENAGRKEKDGRKIKQEAVASSETHKRT